MGYNLEPKPKKVEIQMPSIELTEGQLVDLISTGMADTCGFDWWKTVSEEDYEAARDELISELKPDTDDEICFEQVWARILFNGGKLLVLEAESDWHWKGYPEGTMLWNWQIRASGTEPEGGTWHELTLEKICNGLRKYMHDNQYATVDKLLTEGDFWVADAVFQCAVYGEVQFG